MDWGFEQMQTNGFGNRGAGARVELRSPCSNSHIVWCHADLDATLNKYLSSAYYLSDAVLVTKNMSPNEGDIDLSPTPVSEEREETGCI